MLSYASADKMETLTGQLGQTGSQPATRGYNTTEPARVAGEGVLIPSSMSPSWGHVSSSSLPTRASAVACATMCHAQWQAALVPTS